MLAAQSIHSELELEFEKRGERTVLAKRSTGGLAHVGKPFWNGEVLLTQVVNPTAGFFAGDRLQSTFRFAAGTRVLLSQPGATRIHTMEGSRTAEIAQRIVLSGDALLDFYPDLSISQRGSSLIQQGEIILSPQSRLCYLEILTPGRVAHGERLAWNRLSATLNIYRGDHLMARERMHLPAPEHWRLLDRAGEPYHLATFWLQHPEVSEWAEDLRSLGADEPVILSYTMLETGFAVLRILTTSSIALRRVTGKVRAALHARESGFGQSNALY